MTSIAALTVSSPARPPTRRANGMGRPSIARCGRPDMDGLVRQHAALVRRLAWQVHGRISNAIEVDDLIQTGMVMLIEAARSYEDRGHSFVTYATMRVRGAMIDALRRGAMQCRSAAAKRRLIAAARTRFEQCEGRSPSEREMATALTMPLSQYRATAAAALPMRIESLEALYSDHSLSFADTAERSDDAVVRGDMVDAVARAMDDLPPREAAVLKLYFCDELSLEAVGAELSIGAARVCQIKKSGLERLRGMIESMAD